MKTDLLRERWNNFFQPFELKDCVEKKCLDSAYEDLVNNYREEYRYYHNLEHICNCFRMLDSVADAVDDQFSIEAAIWFHDVIYNPMCKDNEEQSAIYAQVFLNSIQLNKDAVAKIVRLIELTKHSEQPITDDEKYLLDIDVSILGAEADTYWDYEKRIRKEYSQVPESEYKVGRTKVLQHFLDSQYIFYTDYFRDRLEFNARENISKALSRLQSRL